MFHCFNVELFFPSSSPASAASAATPRPPAAGPGNSRKKYPGLSWTPPGRPRRRSGSCCCRNCDSYAFCAHIDYPKKINFVIPKKAFYFARKCSAFALCRLKLILMLIFLKRNSRKLLPFPSSSSKIIYTDTSSSSSWDRTTMPFPLNGDEKGTPGREEYKGFNLGGGGGASS